MFQVRTLGTGIALIRVDTRDGSLTLCSDTLTAPQTSRAREVAAEAVAHGANVVLVRTDEVLAQTA